MKTVAIIKHTIKLMSAYRFEFFVSIITTPITLLVYYFLWKSIYAYSQQQMIGGYTFHELMSYYVMSMIIGFFIYTGAEGEVSRDIRRGQITERLLRPINYQYSLLSFVLGHRIYSLAIEIIPVFIIAFFAFSLRINFVYLPFFLLSLVLAFILNYLICFIAGMTAFWLTENYGILRIQRNLVGFLSGSILPLTFFPAWLEKISFFLPFQYIRFVPINIWLGNYDISMLPKLFSLQIFWIISLYIISILVWKAGMKKIVAVGV